MREPPVNISTDALRGWLREQYRLAVIELEFLPLGQDSSAWVYRVRTAADISYFLKVRKRVTNAASLLAPRCLRDQGMDGVIAPLPTTFGDLAVNAGDYALSLYPFIVSRTGKDLGMSDQQWIDFGALLHQVHAASISPDLARVLRRDTFTPDGAAMVRQLDAYLMGAPAVAGPAARALAMFWRAHLEDIRTLLERAEDLGKRLAATAPAVVLCHADIHTANVLLDAEQRIWITDWDETLLAPRERDLMFVVGGISRRLVGPRAERLFFQGYGSTAVDPVALAYYRYCWAVSDIGAYGEQVVFRPDLGALTRRDSVESVASLFAPGNIVSIAFASGDAGYRVDPAGIEPRPVDTGDDAIRSPADRNPLA